MATEVANRLVPLPTAPTRRLETGAALIGSDPTRKWTREGDPSGIYFSGVNSSALLTGDIEPSGWEVIDKTKLKSAANNNINFFII